MSGTQAHLQTGLENNAAQSKQREQGQAEAPERAFTWKVRPGSSVKRPN